jgi:hypothetical protein
MYVLWPDRIWLKQSGNPAKADGDRTVNGAIPYLRAEISSGLAWA